MFSNNQVPLKNETSDRINPWISLFLHPRQTTRQLLERETAESAWKAWINFTILLAVVGLIFGLLPVSIWPEKPPLSMKEWFLGIFAVATFNVIMFYFDSYVYWRTSLWLGGQCGKSQMRIVFTWTSIIPILIFGSIDTILTFWLGKESMLVLLTGNIWTLWGLIISIEAIRAATNLSIWRAGLVLISPYAILAGGMFCVIAVFGLIYLVLR